MRVPQPLGARGRMLLAFLLKALSQGLLYCSKPLAKLGYLHMEGGKVDTVHFLFLFVSMVLFVFVLQGRSKKTIWFLFFFSFFF